jgi:hypothetical protein
MANFLVAMPGFTKDSYLALTLRERTAIIREYNRVNRKR